MAEELRVDGNTMYINKIRSNRHPITWLWPLLFAAVIFYIELTFPRTRDTVEYSFIVPANADSNTYQYIESIADLIQSQANHYMRENGRVAIHTIVQPLCSADRHLPWIFPLLNASVFLLLITFTARLLRFRHTPGDMLLLTSGIYIYIAPVSPDIAFQVNYLWETTLVTAFLLLFFRIRNVRHWWIWPLLALFGFITGESNEAFTSGIGPVLMVYLIRHRRHNDSKAQICLAIAFVLGFLVNILAPGNQVRLNVFTSASMTQRIFELLRNNWYGLLLVVVVTWRSRGGLNVRTYLHRFSLAIVAVCSLAITLLIVGTTYINACMGIRWALMLMLLGCLRGKRLNTWWQAAIILFASMTAVYNIHSAFIARVKYTYLHDKYFASTDGRTDLPASLMQSDYRMTQIFANPFTWERRNTDPSAPAIQVWPEGLERLPSGLDTNMIVKLNDYTCAAIQSKSHPRKFYLVKRIEPYGKILSVRVLSFDNPSCIDYWGETDGWRMGVYHNNYPLFFSTQITDSIPK